MVSLSGFDHVNNMNIMAQRSPPNCLGQEQNQSGKCPLKLVAGGSSTPGKSSSQATNELKL